MQAGGVRRRLGKRAATAQAKPGERVAAAAAKARGSVAVGAADRAEQAKVVQVQHDAGTGGTSRRERPPAERRMHVVRVHDVGPHRAAGASDLVALETSVPQRRRRPGASQARARALEHLDRVTALLEQPRDLFHRSLFTALGLMRSLRKSAHTNSE